MEIRFSALTGGEYIRLFTFFLPPFCLSYSFLLSLGGRIPAEESPLADRLSSWVSRIPGASPPPGAIQAYVSNEIWFELGATRATLEGTTLACPAFAQYSGQLREALGVGITSGDSATA